MPERVFREYGAWVYGLARRMVGNDADAEDITQDVFLQVVGKLGTFRGRSQLTTWLHRVTVNAALMHRRKSAQRRERQAGAPVDRLLAEGARAVPARTQQPGPERQALAREAQELIEKAVSDLPPLYRDVYMLAELEGRPYAEVGALLGLRLAAVKSRLHRARLLMRAALAPYVLGPSHNEDHRPRQGQPRPTAEGAGQPDCFHWFQPGVR